LSPVTDPEDDAALAVLDKLGRVHGPDETSVPEPEDEVEEVLRRLYHETIGILAYALEPAAVEPGARARLLAAVTGDETQELVEEAPASPAPSPPRPLERAWEPLALPQPDLPGRTAGAVERRGRGGWMLAAAAVLAFAGLGLFAAYLQSELNSTRVRLARTERERLAETTEARAALDQLRGRFERMTAPATTIYPLRCPTGHGPAAGARVYVYVSPDGRRWELAAHGLDPEPAGSDYQVWFLVGEQPLSAGCFNVRDGKPVITMALAPPAGATGAAVSIEPRGGSPRPTGPVVLLADHAVRL
jgi:hypothetical protein